MNDKKIITEKELNYIETLYLSCNLQDFLKEMVTLDNMLLDVNITPPIAYDLFMDYYSQYLADYGKYLGDAKGRSWYQFKNYRVGIMQYDRAKKANQYNCVIQYEQKHLFTLDYDLSFLDLPFSGDRTKYKIKRIDVTKIAKLKTDYTKGYGYISPFRREDYVNGTIYLGHRKNGNVFRMYDKTKELLTDDKDHPINYAKIDLLSRYFGDIENLTTFELELQREYLKGSLGIDTLSQLPKVYQAYKNIVGKIRFYKDSDRNKKLVRDNNRDRISCKKLTDYVEYDRVEKKRYSPSSDYAVKQIIRAVDGYIERTGLSKTNENYMMLFNRAMMQRVDHKHKDMVISFKDTPLSDEIAKMTAKHNLMRDSQTNELELEARAIFDSFS